MHGEWVGGEDKETIELTHDLFMGGGPSFTAPGEAPRRVYRLIRKECLCPLEGQ